jgi:LPS export ABC transporter permease LptF/LPS export ABC transporter permease LptG
MRILTRYILKEVSSHTLLGLVIFTFVIYFPKLNRLLELVVRRGMSASDLIILLLLPIPEVLVITIPIAILLGTLVGLSRMGADGEVIAARAAGVTFGQFARPVMLYAVLGCLVASAMSMVLAPASAWKLMRMEDTLESTQLPYEIQPRVFIEQFPHLLLYLRDVRDSGLRWKGVFIADTTHPDSSEITLAQSGYLVSDRAGGGYILHLERGTTQTFDPQNPRDYNVNSFANMDIHIATARETATIPSLRPAPAQQLPQLLRYIQNPRYGRDGLVELNSRLALPLACLALAWVGLPLSLVRRGGGKSVGVLLAILLVFIYYVIMALGMGFAKQGRINPEAGLWAANLIFGLGGLIMVRAMRLAPSQSRWASRLAAGFAERFRHFRLPRLKKARFTPLQVLLRPRRVRAGAGGGFIQILDLYIVREWIFYCVVMEIALTGIYIIFDFFQLLNYIVRSHATAGLVFRYYVALLPQITYLVLPLSVLVATLVTLSLLTKTSQTIAMKSAGISLYRIALPIALAAAVVSGLMFVLGDRYLPAANQRQDALRNEIQGRPAQTFLHPGWQWIFGQSNRIYNYRFFDPDHAVFANLSVFSLNPSFHITGRIYAQRAFWEPHVHEWILENGWKRQIKGDRETSYQQFSVAGFRTLTETPSYFGQQVRTSEQMSVLELRRYIEELRQSGFDVVRLTVQFYRKFSYPLVALVVALIGIPFAFTVGRKGALSGIALSLAIAIAYWSISSLFQAMGNLNQLPAVAAAWTPDILFGLGGGYLLLRIRT